MKPFAILAAGLLLAACGSKAPQEQPYTLSVDVPEELAGETLFLVNYDTGDKIDSVVVANGKAEFAGMVAEPQMVRLVTSGQRMGTLILEPGNIVMANRIATGTPLNDDFADINNRLTALEEQYADADSLGQLKIVERYEQIEDSAFNANIDNPIGMAFFLDKAYQMSLAELEEFIAQHPAYGNYQRVAKLLESKKAKEATSVGKKFVDFEVTNDSVTYRFSDYVAKGKPVLVDFWASWCGPCIRETQVIKELLEQYGPQGLEVLGVAVWDEPANTLAAVEKHQLPWPQILNAQTIPTDIYGIPAIPCILVIGPDGTILSRDKQGAELRADVAAIMEEFLHPAAENAASAPEQ